MGFASTYLEERALFPEIIKEAPDKQTGIIVVIPAFNEPEISKLLDSLALCTEPECKIEVIIVVNAPANADAASLKNNNQTLRNIESWKKKNRRCFFRLFAFNAETSVAGWGVGLARKTGMDEAVRRFNSINKPEGIILNLDADCLVEQNYLVEVCNELLKRKDRSACSIYFEHPLSGVDFPKPIYEYIILYELHLRYFFQGLAFSGFPYVFHTVGSTIGVKTLPYIKAGGMNRRQAGEDFYFVQKLVPAGGYFNLNSTTVYPSPRTSLRVPFGTGASIIRLSESNGETLFTYNLLAFKELRTLFNMIERIYNFNTEGLPGCYEVLPPGLKSFIEEKEWLEKMAEIRNNTSGFPSFEKRFFGWFNMFKIVKYLNHVHSEIFEKRAVEISACELLTSSGIMIKSQKPYNLLLYYRSMEKNH
jgi:hypothetical protein